MPSGRLVQPLTPCRCSPAHQLGKSRRSHLILLLDTGARYSEIANIEWRRIDLVNRSIHLWRQKVQNETVLDRTERLLEVLVRRATGGAGRFVFCKRNGDPRGYSAGSIRKALQ